MRATTKHDSRLENPEALKGHEGGHVSITGRVDRKAKTVRVAEAKAMKQDETPK